MQGKMPENIIKSLRKVFSQHLETDVPYSSLRTDNSNKKNLGIMSLDG